MKECARHFCSLHLLPRLHCVARPGPHTSRDLSPEDDAALVYLPVRDADVCGGERVQAMTTQGPSSQSATAIRVGRWWAETSELMNRPQLHDEIHVWSTGGECCRVAAEHGSTNLKAAACGRCFASSRCEKNNGLATQRPHTTRPSPSPQPTPKQHSGTRAFGPAHPYCTPTSIRLALIILSAAPSSTPSSPSA